MPMPRELQPIRPKRMPRKLQPTPMQHGLPLTKQLQTLQLPIKRERMQISERLPLPKM
jgi:hypothetical protein